VFGSGNCVDTDNFDGDIAAVAPRWANDGCQYAIVGCQVPEIARAQVAALAGAGIHAIAVYAYLYWGYDVAVEVAKAIGVASEARVRLVYLDCESAGEAPSVTSAVRLLQLREAVALVEAAGLAAGIYTGEPFWRGSMENSTEFARLPLWHAAYWWDRRVVASVSYGGWTRVGIHQYAATGNECYADDGVTVTSVPPFHGVNVDYNRVFEAPEEDEMPMTADEFRAWMRRYFAGDPEGTPVEQREGYYDADGDPIPPDPEVVAAIGRLLPVRPDSARYTDP
jgi:hypothetical protein